MASVLAIAIGVAGAGVSRQANGRGHGDLTRSASERRKRSLRLSPGIPVEDVAGEQARIRRLSMRPDCPPRCGLAGPKRRSAIDSEESAVRFSWPLSSERNDGAVGSPPKAKLLELIVPK